MPPNTPQYNNVAERALGLLRKKTISLLVDLRQETGTNVKRVWAEAWNYATIIATNMCVTPSNAKCGTASQLRLGN